MPNTNEKLNLPIVNAIEELKASNKDQRERLQKSTRAGLLAVRKSVDGLNANFVKAFELQKIKDAFDREKAREDARKDTKEIQEKSKKSDKDDSTSLVKLGLLFGGLAVALGTAVGSITAWTTGVVKAGKAITSFVGKITGISKSGTFSKITAGLDGALKAVKGWNTKILDVLKSGVGKLSGAVSSIANSKFVTTIGNWFKEIKSLGSKVASGFKAFSKTSKTVNTTFQAIKGALGAFGAIFNTMSKLATKVFWPISIIFASFTAIKASLQQFADSDYLGGLKTTITVLVDELFAKPLDMVKDAIAWVIGKLGFDETSKAVKSFSFSKLWTDLMDSLFNGISAAIDWLKLLWDDPIGTIKSLWDKMYGEGGVVDWLIFKPVSAVVNWVRGLFGWDKDKDGKELAKFNLRDFVVGIINDVWENIKNIFNDIKSFNWASLLPDWYQEWKGVGKYAKKELTGEEIIQKDIADNQRTDIGNVAQEIPALRIADMQKTMEWLQKNPSQNAEAINALSKMINTQSGSTVTVVAPSTTDASQNITSSNQVNVPAAASRAKSNQYTHPLMQPLN